MFETAVRNKYRFPFKGMLSVEDLWDLNVHDLDSIFKALNSQAKREKEESLLAVQSDADTELETKIAIIRHIVSVKLAEKEAAKTERENKEKKQRIMAILADKQEDDLRSKTVEELTAMLAE